MSGKLAGKAAQMSACRDIADPQPSWRLRYWERGRPSNVEPPSPAQRDSRAENDVAAQFEKSRNCVRRDERVPSATAASIDHLRNCARFVQASLAPKSIAASRTVSFSS